MELRKATNAAALTRNVEDKLHNLCNFNRQKHGPDLAHHGSLRLLLILEQVQLTAQQRFNGSNGRLCLDDVPSL